MDKVKSSENRIQPTAVRAKVNACFSVLPSDFREILGTSMVMTNKAVSRCAFVILVDHLV